MKILIVVFSVFSLNVLAADELSILKQDANHSIQREIKALESSRGCINTSRSVKEFNNCNYDPANFTKQEMQKEEEQPDTATSSERIQTHGP